MSKWKKAKSNRKERKKREKYHSLKENNQIVKRNENDIQW